eukprot:FR734956.1.p1 GENE.FR734956.1~~FR734956.1.p1  ORF type:complete len:215 (+),score=33.63 FR734956.1:167-811(+)
MGDELVAADAIKRERVLIDALPYLDNEYEDPQVQAQVHALIESEMSGLPSRDYLAHLPLPEGIGSFNGAELVQAEMARLAAQEPMAKLDLSRYEVPEPAKELRRDASAWKKAVNNARVQLEHQHNRLVNLELLQKYGSQAWLQQNKALDTLKGGVHEEAEKLSLVASEANVKRKRAQEKTGPRISQLSHDYQKATHENMQLMTAVTLLRKDTKD